MLSIVFYCYAECPYAECRYAECHGAPASLFQMIITFFSFKINFCLHFLKAMI